MLKTFMTWLIIKVEIKGKFKTNTLTNEQIKKYKRHGSELIDGKKFVYAHIIIHFSFLSSFD